MISNVFIKKTLQNTIFFALSYINRYLKHDKKIIMLYTNEGLRDNIKALLDFLIEEGYNGKYIIYCSSNDYKANGHHYPTIRIISNLKGIMLFFRAGYVFYCFGKIPIIPGRNQEVIQMWHGTPFKAADKGMLDGHSAKRLYYTHILSPSPYFAQISCELFSFPLEKFIICGHARTDDLYKEWHLNLGNYNKLVLWAPTFRHSSRMGYNDAEKDNLLPVLKLERLSYINSILQQKGIKIIVKLHPMQNLSDYQRVKMAYFELISHQEFLNRGLDLYKLASMSDALITDYSSIFYDYLLLNRPIGFTEDDIDDYSNNRGYAVDNPDYFKPGFRIKDEDDFMLFIDNLYRNIDDFEKDRKRVNDLANRYQDGKSCLRVLQSVGITK